MSMCNVSFGVQRGSFACEEAGTLVMTLDNSYSYLKSKAVRYHIEVRARRRGAGGGEMKGWGRRAAGVGRRGCRLL